MEIKVENRSHIIDVGVNLMRERGLKSLTMDSVASELSMSKRTLYQIFESKNQFIAEVIDRFLDNHRRECTECFNAAPDTMQALADIFHLHSNHVSGVSIQFFRDMDKLYPDIGAYYRQKHDADMEHWEYVFNKGVSEGVFRTDVNYKVLLRMMEVQMQALKRTEGMFMEEFSIQEIFHTVTISFLRGIATPKGSRILDNYLSKRDKTGSPIAE
jgi:AcrR family transcriptional regulator